MTQLTLPGKHSNPSKELILATAKSLWLVVIFSIHRMLLKFNSLQADFANRDARAAFFSQIEMEVPPQSYHSGPSVYGGKWKCMSLCIPKYIVPRFSL